jgi:hypothetical protein
VKARPSGEKRRKEMQRQERNREKAERRKVRKEERLQRAASGAEGATTVAPDVDSGSSERTAPSELGAVSASDGDAMRLGASQS